MSDVKNRYAYDKESRTLRHVASWNAAIEAAASTVDSEGKDRLAAIIRKLKK